MIESALAPTIPLASDPTAPTNLTRNTLAGEAPREVRRRWWIDYRIHGDLRFISHHDAMRLFRRALARAAVPVRFSEGFNPHPRMTIPLPRALGVSSDAEVIVIETDGSIDCAALLERLVAQMPPGLTLLGIRNLAAGERPQPDTVTYRFRPTEPLPDDTTDRIRCLLEAESLPVERLENKTKRTRMVDLRPYLIDLRDEDGEVVFTIRVTGTGSARPHEVIDLLIDRAGPVNHRIHRESVRWR